MAVFGGISCLLVAAAYRFFADRKSAHWGVAILLGALVASTPLSRLWRQPDQLGELLVQSLLLASIAMLWVLLLAILTPRQSLSPARPRCAQPVTEAIDSIGPPAIHINADRSSTQPWDIESEELYAQLRDQAMDVDLVDSDEWMDQALEPAESSEKIAHVPADFDAPISDAVLLFEPIDAEDLTPISSGIPGEPVRPATSDPANIPVPATLADALSAAITSAETLQKQVDDLHGGTKKLADAQENCAIDSCIDQLYQAKLLLEKDALIQAESEVSEAAEQVIQAQRIAFNKAIRQHHITTQLLKHERSRLIEQQNEIIRSRQMARRAAQLARRAALNQQAIKNVALQEQEKRLRALESTRKAMDIARNAINALSAGERKKITTHH